MVPQRHEQAKPSEKRVFLHRSCPSKYCKLPVQNDAVQTDLCSTPMRCRHKNMPEHHGGEFQCMYRSKLPRTEWSLLEPECLCVKQILLWRMQCRLQRTAKSRCEEHPCKTEVNLLELGCLGEVGSARERYLARKNKVAAK